MDREIRHIVEREFRNPGRLRHSDSEEVGILHVVQHESRPQVFLFGPDLDVVELNALHVPHVEAV